MLGLGFGVGLGFDLNRVVIWFWLQHYQNYHIQFVSINHDFVLRVSARVSFIVWVRLGLWLVLVSRRHTI